MRQQLHLTILKSFEFITKASIINESWFLSDSKMNILIMAPSYGTLFPDME